MFDKADANNDGQLDADEWKEFYRLMAEKLNGDMGGSYTLSDE